MRALYRTAAVLLTLLSAGMLAILISIALDGDRDIRVVNFTLFALGAAVALVIAVALWARASDRKGSAGESRTPRP